MLSPRVEEKIIRAVDELKDEIVTFLQELIRFDTTVPPGRNYPECSRHIGDTLKRFGYDVEYIQVPDEYMKKHIMATRTGEDSEKILPRVNVLGRLKGSQQKPVKHFTGHYDVVPAGDGWSVDPFGGEIRDGKIYGRGSTDMKSGIAASIFAVEALRRAGLTINGTIEQSATVDEEVGGFTGLGYLVEKEYIKKGKQDWILYTECLDADGICIGHRGALFFDLVTHGKVGHGCMPHFAVNAIDKMIEVSHAINTELRPEIEKRISTTPIMPEKSKMSNLMPIWFDGFAQERPAATIAPTCTSFWNRWFNPEENTKDVRDEITSFLEELKKRDPELDLEYKEHFYVESILVPTDNDFVRAYQKNIKNTLGKESHFKLSPGFDDQRFVVVNGEIDACIVYGPGVLNLAHLPDEYIPIDDLVNAAKVMALSTAELVGVS